MSQSAIGEFLCFKKFSSTSKIFGFVRCNGFNEPVSFEKSCKSWLELSTPVEKSILFLDGIHFYKTKNGFSPRATSARFASTDEVLQYEKENLLT